MGLSKCGLCIIRVAILSGHLQAKVLTTILPTSHDPSSRA